MKDLLDLAIAHPLDTVALLLFFVCWLGYEPILTTISKKSGVIVKDLSVVRAAWMREMTIRNFKLYDSNLMGHAVDSATHFTSVNMILVAAIAGAMFSGHLPLSTARALGFAVATALLFQIKLALVLLCLARGLLNFVWSLRQMNYSAAAAGSIPEHLDERTARGFSEAMTDIIEPAMSNFSQGVRGYYFALAAGAWLFGPIYLIIATLGAMALLSWRQSRSQAARGLRKMRYLLENHPYPTTTRPVPPENIMEEASEIDADNDAPQQKSS
jgi:uncharacterized membrane protein